MKSWLLFQEGRWCLIGDFVHNFFSVWWWIKMMCFNFFLICWYVMYSHRSYVVIVLKRNDKKVGNNPRKTFVKSPMNCRKDCSKTTNKCLWFCWLFLFLFTSSTNQCLRLEFQASTLKVSAAQTPADNQLSNQADKGQLNNCMVYINNHNSMLLILKL